MSDIQYCLNQADDYRKKAEAANSEGAKDALEAIVRGYLPKAQEPAGPQTSAWPGGGLK
jgi:hypothetical protein